MNNKQKNKGLSVRVKIIGLGISSIVLSILVVAVASFMIAESSLEEEAFNRLKAVRTIKTGQMKDFFNNIDSDANVFATLPFIETAIKNLDTLSKEAKAEGYIGKKMLDYLPYKTEFDKYYPFFKKYMEENKYYDVFLFSPNSGRILLTVALQNDFGTELKNENTHLAKAWKELKNDKKMKFTDFEPYAPSNDAPAMFILEPSFLNGKYIGSIGFQVSVDAINKIMQERAGMGKTGESYLVGSDKRMRSDSYEDKEFHSVVASFKGTVEKNGIDTESSREALNGKTGVKVTHDHMGDEVMASYAPLDFFGLRWAVISKINMSEVDEPVIRLRNLIIIFFIVIVALTGFIFFVVINKSIIRPIVHLKEISGIVAKGDLTTKVDVQSSDEIGELGVSFNMFIDNIHTMVVQIINASQNLAQAVQQIASGNQNLSQRVSEQASSLEEIASTVEEANATTRQNTDNAAKANKLAEESYQMAEEGGRVSGEAVAGINEINEVSKKIGDITSVINEISFQTNLLALNAAVEAARAGEAGRGFAVVAGEIRNLAQRSGNAAKEIEELIKDTIGKIETGSGLVNKSGESLSEIIKGIGEVNRIVNEITAASNEQTQGMDQLNLAVTEMDNMTQQNAALVEETASASEEMSNQAQELLGMTDKFTVNDDRTQAAFQQKKVHITGVEKEIGKIDGKKPEVKTERPNAAVVDKKSGNDLKTIMSEEGFEEF